MLLTDSDGSWTAAEAPLPANAQAPSEEGTELSGVSCPSASQCVAGGWYKNTAGALDAVLLTDSGGSWTTAQAPLPADADTDVTAPSGAYVWGVSCPSVSQCVAIGQYYLTDNEYSGLLLTGAG
jgi:hypothetical protein